MLPLCTKGTSQFMLGLCLGSQVSDLESAGVAAGDHQLAGGCNAERW